MLYISNIFNVDTKEHYDRIKSFTQAQMMYCVELRDFTTGEQRAVCMPKVVVAEEIIPFGVVEVPNTSIVADDSTLGISDNHLFIKTRVDEYKILTDYLVDHKYFLTENKLYIPDAQDYWHCFSLQPEFLKLHLKLVVKGVLRNSVLHY